jgi:hypothetical protein
MYRTDWHHGRCRHLWPLFVGARRTAPTSWTHSLPSTVASARSPTQTRPRNGVLRRAIDEHEWLGKKIHPVPCHATLHRMRATNAPSNPPAATCTFVWPSISRKGLVSRTGCSGGSSVMIWFRTSACRPACKRTPAASYITCAVGRRRFQLVVPHQCKRSARVGQQTYDKCKYGAGSEEWLQRQ